MERTATECTHPNREHYCRECASLTCAECPCACLLVYAVLVTTPCYDTAEVAFLGIWETHEEAEAAIKEDRTHAARLPYQDRPDDWAIHTARRGERGPWARCCGTAGAPAQPPPAEPEPEPARRDGCPWVRCP